MHVMLLLSTYLCDNLVLHSVTVMIMINLIVLVWCRNEKYTASATLHVDMPYWQAMYVMESLTLPLHSHLAHLNSDAEFTDADMMVVVAGVGYSLGCGCNDHWVTGSNGQWGVTFHTQY